MTLLLLPLLIQESADVHADDAQARILPDGCDDECDAAVVSMEKEQYYYECVEA